VTPAQLTKLGLGIGVLGALVIAFGALIMIMAMRSYGGASDQHHRREKWANLVGSLLVAVAFGLALAAALQR
jgi:hypothetical protein